MGKEEGMNSRKERQGRKEGEVHLGAFPSLYSL